MKRLKTIIYPMVAVIFLGIFSCSKMDDYMKYTNGKELIYTGKVDSVVMRSGDERVVFNGLLISDPKITKIKIYWNTRTDSLELPITRSVGIDTLQYSIPLPEGAYNFEIFSFDKDGNSSINVNASGTSYGNVYKQNLYNRLCKDASWSDDDIVIKWYNGEETSPYAEIKYTDMDNKELIVKVPAEEETTTLKNYKKGTKFTVQTFFLPDTTCVDTFKTDILSLGVKEDVTDMYMKNTKSPFVRSVWDGNRWGCLEHWITNDAMRSRGGGLYGGYDNYQGNNCFGFERWGGDEKQILNGKIYQTFTVLAGKYQYTFSYGGGNPSVSNNGSDPRYMVVAAGSTLPDVDKLPTALASVSLVGVPSSEARTIEFTVDQPTEISLGVVVYWTNTEQNIRADHIQLIKLPD